MSNSSQLPSVAAPSSMLVLVDLRADFFLSLFSPLPLAIHIAACPSHIHWPCPGCALLVFRPVVVERYTPTWHQTATLCPSIHSADICLSSVEGKLVEVKGASCLVIFSGSHGHNLLLNPDFSTDMCDRLIIGVSQTSVSDVKQVILMCFKHTSLIIVPQPCLVQANPAFKACPLITWMLLPPPHLLQSLP